MGLCKNVVASTITIQYIEIYCFCFSLSLGLELENNLSKESLFMRSLQHYYSIRVKKWTLDYIS